MEDFPEFQCIFQKVGFLERHSWNHPFANQSDAIFEPPAFHVMAHASDGHFTTHYIHGCPTDKSSAQDQGMDSRSFQTFGYLQTFFQFHSPFETITHIHFYEYG